MLPDKSQVRLIQFILFYFTDLTSLDRLSQHANNIVPFTVGGFITFGPAHQCPLQAKGNSSLFFLLHYLSYVAVKRLSEKLKRIISSTPD